jgi:hypothetical protein
MCLPDRDRICLWLELRAVYSQCRNTAISSPNTRYKHSNVYSLRQSLGIDQGMVLFSPLPLLSMDKLIPAVSTKHDVGRRTPAQGDILVFHCGGLSRALVGDSFATRDVE